MENFYFQYKLFLTIHYQNTECAFHNLGWKNLKFSTKILPKNI